MKVRANPFARARAIFAAIAAAGLSQFMGTQALSMNHEYHYRSRGKGEGLPGNKRAKSSFKQNKRRGL